MNNASAVFLNNVDDYLAPSQACVNPLYTNSSSSRNDEDTKRNNEANITAAVAVVVPRRRQRGKTTITPNSNVAVIPVTKKDPIKASMADCLACSGCVTTAETVLLEQQHSLSALKTAMQQQQQLNHRDTRLVVATISPAVWADLLRHLGIPVSDQEAISRWKRKLVTSLHDILSVSAVLDGNVPLKWSLLELGEEFCLSFKARHQPQHQLSANAAPLSRQQLEQNKTPSVAINCNETKFMLPDGSTHVIQSTTYDATPTPLPLLTSSCPALVCLVEKSSHDAVRHLAHTKSPMSLAGAWWRRLQQQQGYEQPRKLIFHLAFMPCHDKKLEASRKDFARPTVDGEQQDVDLVLTTQEWFQLLVEYVSKRTGADELSKEDPLALVKEYLESLPLSPLDAPQINTDALTSPCVSSGTLLATLEEVQDAESLSMDIENKTENHDEMDVDSIEGINNDDNLNKPHIFTMGSGGMAEFVFRYAAWRLFDTKLPDHIVWKPVATSTVHNGNHVVSARVRRATVRSRDYYQATLYRHESDGSVSYSLDEENGKPVLRFAIGYGLQTVQRVLELFQSDKQSQNGPSQEYPFDFVEAMACPSGCLNGGGQLRIADRETPTQNRQRVAATQELFVPLSYTSTTLTTNLDEWKATLDPFEHQTHFHVVPPLAHSMGAAAGVPIKDTQW